MVFSRRLPGKQHDLTLFLFFFYWLCSLTAVKVSSSGQAVIILRLWTWPFKLARNGRRFLLLLFSETVFVLFHCCRVNVLDERCSKGPSLFTHTLMLLFVLVKIQPPLFFTQVLLLQQQQSGSFFNLTHVLKAVSSGFFSSCLWLQNCFSEASLLKLGFIQDPCVTEICLGHVTNTSANHKPQSLVAGAEER